MPLWTDGGGPPVVAFGGNALLPDPADPAAAQRNAEAFAEVVLAVAPEDSGLVLVHGNGPQVGVGLLRAEAARAEVPPDPLDVLVAETQASIGYLLCRALHDALHRMDRDLPVVTIVTQVVVDPAHPSMGRPTKPVGPFYPQEQAARLAAERGWELVEVPGRGSRRVVPSPPPVEVVEIEAVRRAAAGGGLVIAGGGGGIPVARRSDGSRRGVEAVIDKDRTGSLLARSLDARGLIILTEVDHVSTGFGTPDQAAVPRATIAEAERLLAAGEFPPGSMGPKVEASIEYVQATGRPVLITSVEAFSEAIAGQGGTWVVP